MDNLREAIEQLTSRGELKQLKTFLTENPDLLVRHRDLDSLLNTLSPATYSLAWIFILHTKVKLVEKLSLEVQRVTFIQQVVTFVEKSVEAQIRLSPKKFAEILRKYTEILIDGKAPLQAIRTLKLGITKIRLTQESLTSLHSDLSQVCILSKNYTAALSVLDSPILEIDQQNQGITHKDFLTYYYYGGMIYIGLKEFQKALDFFKNGLTVPAQALSAIMVETYKKYVLVSLLVRGEMVSLPKFASAIVSRLPGRNFMQPYQEFINAYGTHSIEDLHKCIQTHSEIYHKDKNAGLVKQCLQSLYRKNIQRLTQTYLTLSLTDIAETVKLANPKHAELAILRMIEDGAIHARINQKDGMVSFEDDPERFDTNKTLERVDKRIENAKGIATKLQTLDEYISTNTVFIQRTLSVRSREFMEPDLSDHLKV